MPKRPNSSNGSCAVRVSRRLRDTRAFLQRLAWNSARPLLVFAIDGIPFPLAERHWRSATLERVRSEVPTSSAACWLSSVTGLAPAEHGALGAVQRFEVDDCAARLVFARAGGTFGARSTVFDDMRAMGRRAICCDADLCELNGEWRDVLVRGAEPWATGPFYANGGHADASTMVERILYCIQSWLAEGPDVFVWTFVDLDLHIHHHGYDCHVEQMLGQLDELFTRCAQFADIVAYSDHGLVPTMHDPVLADLLHQFCERHGLELAGAGRMRWLYGVDPQRRETLMANLAKQLPADVSVHAREEVFPEFTSEGRFRHRVGEIVLIARTEKFLTSPHYRYEHGGLTDDELFVPLALWRS